jgi:hypothetical protein
VPAGLSATVRVSFVVACNLFVDGASAGYELPGSGLARRDPPPLDDTPFPLRSANAMLAALMVVVY